jgi:hypothetical protein
MAGLCASLAVGHSSCHLLCLALCPTGSLRAAGDLRRAVGCAWVRGQLSVQQLWAPCL